MPRFAYTKYKPTDDSSPGYRTVDPRRVVLQIAVDESRGTVEGQGCPCGCGEFPVGPKATFKMGHDARLRGKLIRAYLMGVEIRELYSDGRDLVSTAEEVADRHGWREYLRHAELAREGQNRQVLREALNSERVIKVGRWEYTGQVVAVYPTPRGEEYRIRYVTRMGGIREKRVPATEAPLQGQDQS